MNIYHPSRQLVHDVFYAVREAGFIMRDARRNKKNSELSAEDVTDKDTTHAQVNFVTVYDRKVQAFLIEKLQKALPQAVFLAEEDDANRTDPKTGLCFVIDPIDGTANFIRGLSCSAVSVALLAEGIPVLGAVYQPYAGELFLAVKGEVRAHVPRAHAPQEKPPQ